MRPLFEIQVVSIEFTSRVTATRIHSAAARKRWIRIVRKARCDSRWQPAAPASICSGIAVIAVAHSTSDDRAEDSAENGAATVTSAGVRTATVLTVRTHTAIRIGGNGRRPGNRRSGWVGNGFSGWRGRRLHDLDLRLGVRNDRRFRPRLHRWMLRLYGFRAGAPPQSRRRRGGSGLWYLGEREALGRLLRREIESVRRRELQVSFEIVAHRPIGRRSIFPARRENHCRRTDCEHR